MATRDILSSISRRTILAAGIGLIAILVSATVVVLAVLRNEALERAGWHLENLTSVLAEQTRQSLQAIEIVTRTTADELMSRDAGKLRLSDRQLFDRMRERIEELPNVGAMAFIDARGNAVVHSDTFPAPAVSYADREYFRAHRERRIEGLYVAEPVLGARTREWANVFSRRVEDARGEFKGIVFAAVHVPYLENLFGTLNLGRRGRVALLREDGVLLATHPDVENAIGRSLAQDPLFKIAVSQGAPVAHRRAGLLDQVPRVITLQRVKGYPLLVTVSSTENFILAGWRRDAWRIGTGAAAVTVILGAALFFLLRQRQIDEELAGEVSDAEVRWRAAIEAAGHGVWDWDVKSGQVFRSPHYHKLLGYAIGEIPAGNDGWLKLLHPDDREQSHQANSACLEGDTGSFSAELRLRCKDGSWKWILNRGTVVGRDEHGKARRVLGTITDLSEHRHGEQRVRESEARLNGIIGSAMDAIITVDENQRIVIFNAAAEKIFGCPVTDAIGSPLERFIPKRFRAAHQRHIERFGQTQTTTRMMGGHIALNGLRANGEEFPIDASISQVSVSGRKLYTVILRDITQRKKAEQALAQTYEELRDLSGKMHEVREAERLRVARELHDELAQWLTVIRMDVSWLASRMPQEPSQLARRLEKLKGVVDTTVAAVRRIASDLRPVMLDDLGLIPALEHLLHELSQRSGIVVSLDADERELHFGEPLTSSLYRMVQEALTNVARHAGATEVQVTVGVGDDERLVLAVRDNGRGYDPEIASRRKSYGILGIRERAITLGGTARIERIETGGTLVEIVIPVAPYRRREAEHDTGAIG